MRNQWASDGAGRRGVLFVNAGRCGTRGEGSALFLVRRGTSGEGSVRCARGLGESPGPPHTQRFTFPLPLFPFPFPFPRFPFSVSDPKNLSGFEPPARRSGKARQIVPPTKGRTDGRISLSVPRW